MKVRGDGKTDCRITYIFHLNTNISHISSTKETSTIPPLFSIQFFLDHEFCRQGRSIMKI